MNEIQKKKTITIVIDWVILIVILGIDAITSKIPPFERQFKLDDVTISHPHKGDTIKMVPMVVVSLIVTGIIITAFSMKNFSKYNYHQALFGCLFAVSISTLFAHVIKTLAGRYRPDFMSVCNVDFEKVEQLFSTYNVSSTISYGPRNLYNTTICKTPREELFEERKSFPSGHSSFIFSVMTYLSFYIAGQIHLMDRKSFIWKYLVVALPYLVAIMVALSRVFDYRHHWQDVTIGSLIGLFFGVVTYYYYFPSLTSIKSKLPFQRFDSYIKSNDNDGEINININAV